MKKSYSSYTSKENLSAFQLPNNFNHWNSYVAGIMDKYLTFAAFRSSSARHSAMLLMFLNALSLVPVQSNQIA